MAGLYVVTVTTAWAGVHMISLRLPPMKWKKHPKDGIAIIFPCLASANDEETRTRKMRKEKERRNKSERKKKRTITR